MISLGQRVVANFYRLRRDIGLALAIGTWSPSVRLGSRLVIVFSPAGIGLPTTRLAVVDMPTGMSSVVACDQSRILTISCFYFIKYHRASVYSRAILRWM